MPDPTPTKPWGKLSEFGLFQGPDAKPHLHPSDVVCAAVCLLWLILVGGFFLFSGWGSGGGAAGVIMALVAIFLPIAVIGLTALAARTARTMRQEAQELHHAIDALRQAYDQQNALQHMPGGQNSAEASGHQNGGSGKVATFTSRRDFEATQPSADRKAALVNPSQDNGDEQPRLALGTPAEELTAPISVGDFIRALNFPDSPDDKDSIRALRRALDDRSLAKLIRAAQDVLTLLGQDGIYMDDLKADRAKPEIWRRFATGERGKTIAALGGVRDRSCLALAAGRMRHDTIFRDAAHHFLRQFDKTVADFEKNASDQDIVALANTRTARAFMLLGRVTGTFD